MSGGYGGGGRSPLARLALPTRGLVTWSQLVVLSLMLTRSGNAAERCEALSPSVTQRLAAFVASKYELAPDVGVEDGSTVGATCFRRVGFRTGDRSRLIELYLSPDQQYLSESLWDSEIDPAIERRRVAEQTDKDLRAGDSPHKGRSDAPVTIIVFSEFQCPFCKRFADLFAALPEADAKQVNLVFKHFPLGMHEWARPAALATACAGMQGADQFWSVHDLIFTNQNTITAKNFYAKLETLTASAAGVNAGQLQLCLQSGAAEPLVTRDAALVEKYHLDATPTVFVNGVRKQGGFRTTAELEAVIRLKTLERQSAEGSLP
jgi:protein-disulfide isomerase